MANLFIAMGGSGLKTVREIREKHREGDYFLFIDTDTNDLVDAKGNPFSLREKVDLAEINVTSYLQTAASNNEVRKKVDTWLDPNARATMKNGPLEKGASANRPQGRLAIASIAGDFKNKIKLIIKSIDDIHKNEKDKLQTFIVLSVAGGTGSSIYLDLTQILYDELYKLKGHDFSKPTAVLFMPDVFVGFQEGENVDRYKTNVFAFWKELDAVQRDYFGSINQALITSNDTKTANAAAIRETNFSKFAIIADEHSQGRVPFQPFNSAILIDHENMAGQATDIKQRYKDVARLLEMISVRTHGGTIKSALDNTILPNSVTSLTNNLPWVKQYWSAGYSEIRSGRDFFDEYVKTNLKRVVYENFIGINGASKDNIDLEVRPLFQNNFLAYIETDKYNGFDNKAKEVDGKPLNLGVLKEKYWKDYLESNIDKQYSNGIDTKDESSAEGLKRLFDNDIKDKTPSKLIEFIFQSGFQTDSIITKILNEFYDGGTEIALSQGLMRLSFVYEKLETRIDDLSMLYDSELKALSDLKSNVIIESQNIINRNLADTVITQYATIKEGPAWNVIKKAQWYETELTNLKNLIKAYYDYHANELLLKLKKEICDKMCFGQSNNMHVRGNLTKVINSLTGEIDGKIKPNAHKHLVNKYHSYKNNALTTIIPNIANFADGFEDSNKNIFKRIFETECGIATGIKDGQPFFIQQTAAKTDLNSKSIEDLIRITFNENKFVLNNMQNGSESAAKFIESLDKLIETKLISNLNSILTKGKSLDNTSTGYPKYISYTLEDWINVDTDSFNSIKSKFDKRASVFCNLVNVSPEKEVWLSPQPLRKRIDDIFTADGDTNIPKYAHEVTTEDVIICIKYLDNLSFDNYYKFIQYKDHYRFCLTKNINTYYPHIDVRFKNGMRNFLHDVENQTPLLNVLLQGSTETINDPSTKSKIDATIYLTGYANFYFLAKLYEKLNNADNNVIYKNLVMSDSAFESIITGKSRKEMFNPPVFIDGNRIQFFSSNDINKLQNKGIIWLSNVTLENTIELANKDTLSNDLQKVIMLGESLPSSWGFIQSHNSFTETNMACIKKRYAITNDKTLFKSVLTETIKEVKEDIMKLMPTEEDYKDVFNTFYVKYSNELNKLIL